MTPVVIPNNPARAFSQNRLVRYRNVGGQPQKLEKAWMDWGSLKVAMLPLDILIGKSWLWFTNFLFGFSTKPLLTTDFT